MKVLLVDQIAKVTYKYTYSLANALQATGNEVHLVMDQAGKSNYLKCESTQAFYDTSPDVGKIRKVKEYIKACKYITQKLKEGYDVLHIQWILLSPLDWYFIKKIKKESKCKLIISVHDILPFNEKFYDKHFHKKIYDACDQIIVQAKTNIKRFDQLFPECSKKVTYIPHGHFLDFVDKHDKSEAKEHLNIPKDKNVLLFFGQIKKVKGVGVLLEAFGKLLQKHNNYYLIIAGNIWKDDFEPYKEIVDKYGITDNNLRLDLRYIPDEEVGYYYSACDASVLPYLDVYQSGVIQLCYAYEKPAIATRIPSFMEIVKDGETGFLCNVNDSSDLARVIVKAFDNKDRLPELGAKGKELIKDKFDWNKIAKKINELYLK